MKEKIYNSLNSIVPTNSQKEMIFQNITRPRNKLGGYILKNCMMAACFVVTFTLFLNQTSIDENNKMPRTINHDYEQEECMEAFDNK